LEGDSLFEVLLPGFVSLVTACSSYHIREGGLAFASFLEVRSEKRLRSRYVLTGHPFNPTIRLGGWLRFDSTVWRSERFDKCLGNTRASISSICIHKLHSVGFVDFVWRPLALRALDRVGKTKKRAGYKGAYVS
jgi:hypothetical protein